MKLAKALKVLAVAGVLGAGVGGALGVLSSGGLGSDSRSGSDVTENINPGVDEHERGPPLITDEPENGRSEANPGIDYNCALPGRGFPWLDHEGPITSENPDTGEKLTWLYGYFVTKIGNPILELNPIELHLPVRLYDGEPRWDEVYELLCNVHPDLGGTGLDKLTFEEVGRIVSLPQDADLWKAYDHYYSDGTSWEPGEARIHDEGLRIYYLDPISQELADALSTREGEMETEYYKVVLVGHETAKVPGRDHEVTISYNIEFELKMEWRIDDLVSAESVVKSSSVDPLMPDLDETEALYTCVNCQQMRNLLTPKVTFPYSGEIVWFTFDHRNLVPRVEIDYSDGSFATVSLPLFFEQASLFEVRLLRAETSSAPPDEKNWSPDTHRDFTTTGALWYEMTALDK